MKRGKVSTSKSMVDHAEQTYRVKGVIAELNAKTQTNKTAQLISPSPSF